MNEKITYIAPVLVDLSYVTNVSGACDPFGSQDNTGDCSTGNNASGSILSCRQGDSPVDSVCWGGNAPVWACISVGGGV